MALETLFVHSQKILPDASYEEFAAAQGGSASASASASSSASSGSSPGPSAAGTKHVEIVITSDVPVDVSIMDDNFQWTVTEEISGTRTYENDIASDSGLLVDAISSGMNGNVTIKVYENGELRTQDSDSTGFAQVSY